MNFILGVGAQKAGTTLLYDLLSQSKQVDVAAGNEFQSKELHYFDKVANPSLNEYAGLFENKRQYKLDITPDYMFYPNAIERIHKTLPKENVKLIALLRNPLERAESHYYMSRRRGFEKQRFERTLELEPERMSTSDFYFREMSYFARGKYYAQVKKLYDYFPRQNIKIVIFEDFIKSQQETLNDICDFLHIKRIEIKPVHSHKGYDVRFKFLPKFFNIYGKRIEELLPHNVFLTLRTFYRRMNRTDVKKYKIDQNFIKELENYYDQDIQKLKKLLDRDLSQWSIESK